MRSPQLLLTTLLVLFACQNDSTSETETPVPTASPTVEELLPTEMLNVWQPWLGDFDGMVERRVVRALTTYGGYQFYYRDGKPRGAVVDMLDKLENTLNTELGRRNIRVYVVPIPLSREQLIPSLLAGHGDFIASDLTITAERARSVEFTRTIMDDVAELIVTGPSAPAIGTLDDLSGQEVFVRKSSSYRQGLEALSATFLAADRPPVTVVYADELLEAEDIVEMVGHGDIGMTVMDGYKADFWAAVMPDVVVRHDLAIASDQSIAWAHRKDSPQLAERLNAFLREFGRGSLFGNDTYNRHLADARRKRCANSSANSVAVAELAELFTRYGERYAFDWLKLAAQAYQESGLRQDRQSSAGAVGIMQIKPSTAADRNVGIDDVTVLENNIHAGSKYLRFLADRYFSDEQFDELNQWLFSLAAYNAGPARVRRLREEAEAEGYDPAVWFDNVEIIAGRRIGRETVAYVSNIFKYYLAYRITLERGRVREERFADLLVACDD